MRCQADAPAIKPTILNNLTRFYEDKGTADKRLRLELLTSLASLDENQPLVSFMASRALRNRLTIRKKLIAAITILPITIMIN